MRHDEARKLFSRHADNELNERELAEFEAHLAECVICREEWERFKGALDMVKSLDEEPVPDKFVEGVLLKLKSRNKGAYLRLKSGGIPYYFRVPFELFSFLMIIILASLILIQNLSHRIKPMEDKQIHLEKTGGESTGHDNVLKVRSNKSLRIDLKREVLKYKLILQQPSRNIEKGVIDLAKSFGAELKKGTSEKESNVKNGRPLVFIIPKARFKGFMSQLLKGVKVKVERESYFSKKTLNGVEVQIAFEHPR
ncbi:MAG: hypothetical protein GXP49_06170 [Deltaproteobacteria bacterium]|nr:hypothetical protein [Deltaproteobacteria bacterium]